MWDNPSPKGEGSYWRREQLLTASYEGIFGVYPEGSGSTLRFRKEQLSTGEKPVDQKPGASRGSSEVAYGRLGPEQPLVAAIEPWHGNEVVVYLTGSPSSRPETASRFDRNAPSPAAPLPERALTLALSQRERGVVDGRPVSYQRLVLDETLSEGHALVVADFDGDGQDEIVAGWRAGGGGLSLYKWTGGKSAAFRKIPLDRGIAVEGAVAVDLNGDGRLDLVVIAGRTNNLVWYENKGRGKG
jgi:hypothetical protein